MDGHREAETTGLFMMSLTSTLVVMCISMLSNRLFYHEKVFEFLPLITYLIFTRKMSYYINMIIGIHQILLLPLLPSSPSFCAKCFIFENFCDFWYPLGLCYPTPFYPHSSLMFWLTCYLSPDSTVTDGVPLAVLLTPCSERQPDWPVGNALTNSSRLTCLIDSAFWCSRQLFLQILIWPSLQVIGPYPLQEHCIKKRFFLLLPLAHREAFLCYSIAWCQLQALILPLLCNCVCPLLQTSPSVRTDLSVLPFHLLCHDPVCVSARETVLPCPAKWDGSLCNLM